MLQDIKIFGFSELKDIHREKERIYRGVFSKNTSRIVGFKGQKMK